jgi:hypothetical protein
MNVLSVVVTLILGTLSLGFTPQRGINGVLTTKNFGQAGGSRFDESSLFELKVLGKAPNELISMDSMVTSAVNFPSLGEYHERPTPEEMEDMKKKASFNMNVGKAMETLRNQLPFVFASSNLDFSIFAEQMTVTDQRSNRAVMPKSIYVGAVKSLRMAGQLSTLFPSMNLKKIEYIEDNGFIQCLVDVVLPEAVRVDGQAVWEGMFYFGLNEEGLIDSHVFDRQITSFTPAAQISKMPWLRVAHTNTEADFGAVLAGSRYVYSSSSRGVMRTPSSSSSSSVPGAEALVDGGMGRRRPLEWTDLLITSSE